MFVLFRDWVRQFDSPCNSTITRIVRVIDYAEYLTTLKENQSRLHQEAMNYLQVNFENYSSKYKEKDKKHKGVTRESRIYTLNKEEQLGFKWPYLKAIGIYKVNVPDRESQYRYFIISK